jgi:hypothetical protein
MMKNDDEDLVGYRNLGKLLFRILFGSIGILPQPTLFCHLLLLYTDMDKAHKQKCTQANNNASGTEAHKRTGDAQTDRRERDRQIYFQCDTSCSFWSHDVYIRATGSMMLSHSCSREHDDFIFMLSGALCFYDFVRLGRRCSCSREHGVFIFMPPGAAFTRWGRMG